MATLLETTQLLIEAKRGEGRAADQLTASVYEELRALAGHFLRREHVGHTLQPTALVHEAYIRLIDQSRVDWQGRTHFMAVAGQMIRRVLVDHARKRDALKRGAGGQRITLTSSSVDEAKTPPVDLLALDEALSALAALSERQAQVVELRYFGGLSVEEVAHQLKVSERTVKGDWRVAKAWLAEQLS